MSMKEVYKQVPGAIKGLECSFNGNFKLRGRVKNVRYYRTSTASSAYITYKHEGKDLYFSAAKLVARTWLGYKDGCLTYRDGNCRNIKADNLIVGDKYQDYIDKTTYHPTDELDKRKHHLQMVIIDAGLTLDYFNTLNMDAINQRVRDYLYPYLLNYCHNTIHLGWERSLRAVPEAIGIMYGKLMDGMPIFSYELYCKKLLYQMKRTGKYETYWQTLRKPIQIEVEQLNLDCLCEKFKVTYHKK